MNIPTLKEKFLSSIDLWLEERVDEMVKGNSALAIPSVYLKRGCHNILHKYRDNIDCGIDKATLFFADEEGNIDSDTVFTDLMTLFKSMEEHSFDLGIVKGMVGKGEVSITLPDNILMNIVFGSKKTLTFKEEDFLELKSLLLTE